MWLNDESSEIIFKSFQSVDERANSMSLYLSYSTTTKSFNPDFIPSKWVLDLYEDGDIRKKYIIVRTKLPALKQQLMMFIC